MFPFYLVLTFKTCLESPIVWSIQFVFVASFYGFCKQWEIQHLQTDSECNGQKISLTALNASYHKIGGSSHLPSTTLVISPVSVLREQTDAAILIEGR